MEREPWWATGTRTEAERQKPSVRKPCRSLPALVSEFLTVVVVLEILNKWAPFHRLVSDALFVFIWRIRPYISKAPRNHIKRKTDNINHEVNRKTYIS